MQVAHPLCYSAVLVTPVPARPGVSSRPGPRREVYVRRLLSPDGVWLAEGAQRKSEPPRRPEPQRGSTGHTEANAAFLAQLAAIVLDETPPADIPLNAEQAERWRYWQRRRAVAMGLVPRG